MNDEQRLQLLKNQRNSTDFDFVRAEYELDFLQGIGAEELPDFAKGNLDHYEQEFSLLQKKLDWYDLKIEELTAIIENTN
jgi:hypothetical protein